MSRKGKPRSAETKRKISQALKGKRRKRNIAIGTGVALGLAGLLAYKNRGLLRKKGTPENPYIVRAKESLKYPILESSRPKSKRNIASRTFEDTLGKLYRKGSFLPSGSKGKAVSDIGIIRRGVRPIDATTSTGKDDLEWLTVDTEGRSLFSSFFEPYTIEFNRRRGPVKAETKAKISRSLEDYWRKNKTNTTVEEKEKKDNFVTRNLKSYVAGTTLTTAAWHVGGKQAYNQSIRLLTNPVEKSVNSLAKTKTLQKLKNTSIGKKLTGSGLNKKTVAMLGTLVLSGAVSKEAMKHSKKLIGWSVDYQRKKEK